MSPATMRQQDGDWVEVPPDAGVEEGDLVRTYHCVQAPELLDYEITARLSVGLATLTGQLNNELPDCMEAEVEETELIDGAGTVVDGDECEYLYVTTMRITRIEPGCENYTTSGLGAALAAALAVVAILVGISLVFWRAEKFFNSSEDAKNAGRNISIAVLLIAAAWAFTQFAGEG